MEFARVQKLAISRDYISFCRFKKGEIGEIAFFRKFPVQNILPHALGIQPFVWETRSRKYLCGIDGNSQGFVSEIAFLDSVFALSGHQIS